MGAHLVVIMAARKTRTVARRRCRLNRTIRLAAVMAATHTLIRQRKTKGLQHDTEAYSDRSAVAVSGGPWAKLANGTRLYGTARSSYVGAGRDQAHARSRLATAVDVGATGRGSPPRPRRHTRDVQRRFSLSLLHHGIGEEEGDGVRLLIVIGASDALDCCSWR